MPALTKTQIDYLSKRVDSAANDFIAAKTAVFGKRPPAPPVWTAAEKVHLIQSGSAKLLPDVEYYTDLGKAFEYPDVPGAAEAQSKLDTWELACQAVKDEATRRKHQILDELVLNGGAADALARIAAAFKVE